MTKQTMIAPRTLAERYGTTTQTVLAWIHRGELKAVNIGRTPNGRKPRWRISEAAVKEFEESRSVARSCPPQRRARRKRAGSDVITFYD